MKKGKIICGFAGIGKSTCTGRFLKVVDLESTPFDKNWKIYAKVANHMANNGYTVLLSCHSEIRQELLNNQIDFVTVIPSPILNGIDSKTIYLERYKQRGNTQDFIDLMNNNWGKFNLKLPSEIIVEIPLDKYLVDILPFIK